MAKILSELFYGNIIPGEKYCAKEREIRELVRLTERNRESLCAGLTNEQKEALEKYESVVREMNILVYEDYFICGYRLGARMTMEALSED